MWPRVCELAVATWLLVSGFGLSRTGALDTQLVPLTAAVAVGMIFVASRRWRHAHLLTVAVALGLILWGWMRFARPGPPAAQNAILSGLMLALLGIIPNQAMDPPVGWRPHVRDRE